LFFAGILTAASAYADSALDRLRDLKVAESESMLVLGTLLLLLAALARRGLSRYAGKKEGEPRADAT
jgi:hypothetical protein